MTLQKTTTPASNGPLEMARPKRRWRRAAVASVVICGMAVSGIAVSPTMLLNTSLRDRFLNAQLQHTGLHLTSSSALGGWFTPITIRDVRLTDPSGQVVVRIDRLGTSRTLTGLLADRSNLGTVTLQQPEILLSLDEDGNLPPDLFAERRTPASGSPPVFDLRVRDAQFALQVPWRRLPIVELERLNLRAEVVQDEQRDQGRRLTIEPVVLLDQAALAETHTEQNLALIAPVLSQSTQLNGTVSVSLDAFEYELDSEQHQPLQLSGTATFHNVDARLKQDWVAELSRMIGRTIGQDVPDRLQVTRDSEVRFRVDDVGIYHEGLAFLLPDLAPDLTIQSSGIVGLDESLNLSLAVNLPELLPRNPLLSVLSKMTQLPFRIQVRGTVDDPQLVMPAGMSLVDQLSRNLRPKSADQPPPSIGESVGRIVGSSLSESDREKPESIVSGVLNIIRAAQRKEEADEKQPEPSVDPQSDSRQDKRRQRKDRRQRKSL